MHTVYTNKLFYITKVEPWVKGKQSLLVAVNPNLSLKINLWYIYPLFNTFYHSFCPYHLFHSPSVVSVRFIPSLILLICNICIIRGLRGFETSVRHCSSKKATTNLSTSGNSSLIVQNGQNNNVHGAKNGVDGVTGAKSGVTGATNGFLSRRRRQEASSTMHESRRIGANAGNQTTRMVAMLLTISFMFLVCNLPIVILESKWSKARRVMV